MFKVGDVIKVANWSKPSIYDQYGLRIQSFEVLDVERNWFHEDQYIYTLKGLKDKYVRQMNRDDFVLDEKYLRWMKIKQICSKKTTG